MNGVRYFKGLAAFSAVLVLATAALAHGSGKSATAPAKPAMANVFAAPWRSAPSYAPAGRAAFLFGSQPFVRGLAPHIEVSGGIHPSNFDIPLLFTWSTNVPITGSGWAGGESVTIVLHGPMNTLGVAPGDRTISAPIVADGSGGFDTTFHIPYDEGGPYTILRPGLYEVRASGISGTTSAAGRINICPATYKDDAVGIDWGRERGGRQSGVGDINKAYPHWGTVWNEQPIEVYGECSFSDNDGNNMPSFMRHSEFPADHYAHDFNIMLVPDQDYRWTIGTANYYTIEPSDPQPNREFGRMEIEHEMLNNGDTFSYGQGNKGMPIFVLPTPGDRIYAVGRWICDFGHPEHGDRIEIHPPRLIVSIRKHPTVTGLNGGSCMTYASQIDVFLSPQWAGSGRIYHSLGDTLGDGGRIRDVIADTDLYYGAAILDHTGLNAEPFASNGGFERTGEVHAINDMNYDFDVPLPEPPQGATAPHADVTYRDLHATSVVAQITYTNEVNGLPTKAHVHLPALGGDNKIYAATIKFSWDKFKAPARHFQVRLQSLLIKDDSDDFPAGTGEWLLWADISGRWVNLALLDPGAFYDADDDDVIGLSGAGAIDVYCNPGDPLYTAVFGYEQDCLDDLFGDGFDWDATEAALNLAGCDFGNDNDDLAGAIFRLDNPTKTNAPGSYDIPSARAILNDDDSHYNVRFRVDYVPAPPRIEINGVPGDFGNVCIGDCEDRVIEIFNIGEEDLIVNQITMTGAGYSRLGPNLPFTVQGGEHVNVTVRFCPTAPGQGDGTIKFDNSDACQPSLTFDLHAHTVFPIASLSGSLAYGLVPVDDRSVGYFATRTFQINNTGPCPLEVTSVSVTSGAANGFSVGTPPVFPQTIQAGGSLGVPVRFNPVAAGPVSGTISVTVANDPTHATPLTISCSGNGIVPTVSSTPGHTIFEPTVVNCSRSQLITVFNTGPAELIVDSATMTGTGYSLAPVTLPLRLAANASTNLTVTFTPPSIARAFNGTLTLATNDPVHPTISNTFCGEGTPIGIRVLVLKANGTPYDRVDQITISSHGITPNLNVALRDVPLTTVLPTVSCLPITYHVEKALPANITFGTRGSYYNVKAKVGNKAQSVSFTLTTCTFRIIVITLQ